MYLWRYLGTSYIEVTSTELDCVRDRRGCRGWIRDYLLRDVAAVVEIEEVEPRGAIAS